MFSLTHVFFGADEGDRVEKKQLHDQQKEIDSVQPSVPQLLTEESRFSNRKEIIVEYCIH